MAFVVQPILPDYYTRYYKNACSECVHSYTHLLLALGIVREPTVMGLYDTISWPMTLAGLTLA